MAIKLPELDDKTYAELVDEARATIPTIHPGWTDHNATDPGITLIELFAWLTEAIIFRTGGIPEKTERAFLRLLSGGIHGGELGDLGEVTAETFRALRERYRAVTPEDYEMLAMGQCPVANEIARVHCLGERDLTSSDKLLPAPGHLSLIVLPKADDPWQIPNSSLMKVIAEFFAERRVITTRLHIVPVTPVPVTLEATVHLRDDAKAGGIAVRARIWDALSEHFHPLRGSVDRRGWPFGRDVDISDVLAVIDQVAGVEFVDANPTAWKLVSPDDPANDRRVMVDGKQLGLRIDAHELPRFDKSAIALTLKERRGTSWQTIE